MHISKTRIAVNVLGAIVMVMLIYIFSTLLDVSTWKMALGAFVGYTAGVLVYLAFRPKS